MVDIAGEARPDPSGPESHGVPEPEACRMGGDGAGLDWDGVRDSSAGESGASEVREAEPAGRGDHSGRVGVTDPGERSKGESRVVVWDE